MTMQQLPRAIILVVAAWSTAVAVASTSDSKENQRLTNAYRILNTRSDRNRDGCVDNKLFLEVASTERQARITVECDHRELGGVPKALEGDWFVRICERTPNPGEQVDRRLVAAGILAAVDVLRRDYAQDPVRDVYLDVSAMPEEFSLALYQGVTARMEQLNSKVKRFDDQRVKAMVKATYREMTFVEYIKRCLEAQGFAVRIDPAELCCLRSDCEGMKWKDVARQPQAGLNVRSATCCLSLGSNPRQGSNQGPNQSQTIGLAAKPFGVVARAL